MTTQTLWVNANDLRSAQAIAERLGRRFVHRTSAWPVDQEDVAQDLLVHAIRTWHAHRSHRGSRSAFLTAILQNHARTLHRRNAAAKRGAGRTLSSSIVGGAPFVDRDWRRHECVRNRRLDLQRVQVQLPRDLQRTCALLSRESISATARRLRLPRTAVLAQIRRIRRHFIAAGITESEP